jgi:hypothetical protein
MLRYIKKINNCLSILFSLVFINFSLIYFLLLSIYEPCRKKENVPDFCAYVEKHNKKEKKTKTFLIENKYITIEVL